ncbi:hypothetical protein HELRODRAFT_62784, partial [Helobdella robusta]|uniref:Uncharacterized protein n=1 Tax=Helobdella robusta TaxID=6412 RepID=T1FX53_HELRO
IRHIRNFLTEDIASALARCLVLSRLYYCNSLLYGLSSNFSTLLQRPQNRVAKVVLNINNLSSSTDSPIQLHW